MIVVYAEHMNVRDERSVWLRWRHGGYYFGLSECLIQYIPLAGLVQFVGWLVGVGVGVDDGAVSLSHD